MIKIMNRGMVVVITILLLLIGGAVFALNSQQNRTTSMEQKPDSKSGSVSPTEIPKNETNTDDSTSNRYIDYSVDEFEDRQEVKRVYFFHASWCPTCKAAHEEFTSNLASIPEDVVVFKTDYDSQSDLKKKFNITYQHTFVYVDQNGNEIKKWSGGAVDELIENTQ